MRNRGLRADQRLRPIMSIVCKEAAKDEDLADADEKYDDRLSDGPELDAIIELLGEVLTLRLAQAVVRLIVDHRLQVLVDTHRRRFHLAVTKL